MQSKAQNAVNPNGLTSILTQQCEKFALKKRVRIILVCLREALKTESCITVSGQSSAEYTEKRSRFIAVIRHCETEQEAVSFINDIRAKHRDARHNCYAYSVSGGAVKRFSDDGEPHGTAGKPMLDIIDGEGLCNVCAVVTRYFGGVLLGTGGLVRAYSKALKDAAVSANRAVMIPCTVFSCSADYTDSARLSKLISDMGGVTENAEYTEKVSLTFSMRESKKSEFELKLKEMFCARITAKEIKTELRPVSEL